MKLFNKPAEDSPAGVIAFFILLQIVFISLKLLSYIDWNWWWVMTPILVPVGLLILIWLVTGMVLDAIFSIFK